MNAFDVISGADSSSVVLHVPHSSTAIPDAVRQGLLLDGAELAEELSAMTDADTDLLAEVAASGAQVRPWTFVNRLSRLVVDPERFPDEREELHAVGMGAVYERTSRLGVLRRPSPSERQTLLDQYFTPYAVGIAQLVRRRLAAVGVVTIIDVHSYPMSALPYELHANGPRPGICIGTDPFHTPNSLANHATAAMRTALPNVVIGANSPFGGSYMPDEQFRVNDLVRTVMLECRRDVVARHLTELALGLTALINRVDPGE